MKKILFSLGVVGTLLGCASPMPERQYQYFTGYISNLQKCFEKELITPRLYADARTSFSYILSTWNYDADKLSNMISQSYSKAYVTESTCRQTVADTYQIIGDVNQHRIGKKESQKEFEKAIEGLKQNKPVYCNTIGTMTICN